MLKSYIKPRKYAGKKKYKTCPFGSRLRKFALGPVAKSGGLILYLEKFGWSHTLTLCKRYLCSENHKFTITYFWTCVFHYLPKYFLWKVLVWDQVKFCKDRIRPPFVSFFSFHFWKKHHNDWIKCKLFKSKWTGL